jgi:hypothetical protein
MIVLPKLLIQIALIVIIVRCGYVAYTLLNHSKKRWLDIAFYVAVALLALSWL